MNLFLPPREIIKNSITVNKDDDGKTQNYTVKFAGINKEYTIEEKELDSPKRIFYSKGDDDMFLFELAYQKCANDDNCGVDMTLKDKLLYFLDISKIEKMITGQETQVAQIDDFLKMYDEGKITENTVMTLSVEKGKKFRHEYKETIKIKNNHAYIIYKIEDDTVELKDPYDTSKVLRLSKNELRQIKGAIGYINLD